MTQDYIELDNGNIKLYCGDCLDILPTMEAGSIQAARDELPITWEELHGLSCPPPAIHIDSVITDPPYGVNLGSHLAAKDRRTNRVLVKDGYDTYSDTPENFDRYVVPAVEWATMNVARSAVFCAVPSAWRLPTPDAIGGVFVAAGCGRSRWGFSCYAPLWLYGQAPELEKGAYPTSLRSSVSAEKSEHPCPKPVPWMLWAVGLASREGDTILDPFMGSGTTGVACVRTGRRFCGIELDPGYFQIAVDRIQKELDQRDGSGPLMKAQATLISEVGK